MIDKIKSLSFRGVSLAFGGDPVLEKCDFDFPVGKNCRLLFSNDKERFFFFHGVSQLEGFARGEYLINNQNVLDFSFEEFRPYRIQIGFGFSTKGLIHNLTLRQNLELPIRYHRSYPEMGVRLWVESLAEYFELGPDLDRRPSEVSASSQKATLILRAFVHRPRLVFLDSPDVLLSHRHHAGLLQLIDDQRQQANLEHLYFSASDENLADCLSEQNIILTKKSFRLASLDHQVGVAS